MKARSFSAAIAAILLATASVGVSAFAAETTDETASAVEETTGTTSETSEDNGAEGKPNETGSTSVSEVENTENVDMEQFMTITGQLAGNGTDTHTITPNDNSAPAYYGDPHYDTDGNATLIESEQIIYNTEEMQFIAVTTKDGHVFYVLINYSAENGQDNVYFLNNVRNTYGH